jgi:hypothetical protein
MPLAQRSFHEGDTFRILFQSPHRLSNVPGAEYTTYTTSLMTIRWCQNLRVAHEFWIKIEDGTQSFHRTFHKDYNTVEMEEHDMRNQKFRDMECWLASAESCMEMYGIVNRFCGEMKKMAKWTHTQRRGHFVEEFTLQSIAVAEIHVRDDRTIGLIIREFTIPWKIVRREWWNVLTRTPPVGSDPPVWTGDILAKRYSDRFPWISDTASERTMDLDIWFVEIFKILDSLSPSRSRDASPKRS